MRVEDDGESPISTPFVSGAFSVKGRRGRLPQPPCVIAPGARGPRKAGLGTGSAPVLRRGELTRSHKATTHAPGALQAGMLAYGPHEV